MVAKVTVEGCRCCKDRRESHTYEHDLIAMRNIIHGAIFRSEALAAMERLQEAFAERDAQIMDLNAGLDALGRKAASLENDREYNAELVRERDAQIAEMRKITGPKCPKCGHWLKARHEKRWRGPANDPSVTIGSAAFECKTCSFRPDYTVCFTVPDLIANHPLIAATLGLEAK